MPIDPSFDCLGVLPPIPADMMRPRDRERRRLTDNLLN
jgi:hypothetical protein